MKTLQNLISRTVLVVGLSFLLGGCQPDEKPKQEIKPKNKYSVIVSNWVGRVAYGCEYFKRNENIYSLFDKDSTLITEIAITDGYLIRIEKN